MLLLATLALIVGILVEGIVSCAPAAVGMLGGLGAIASLVPSPSVLRLSPTVGRTIRLAGVVILWGCVGWLRAVSLRPEPSRHLVGRLAEEPRAVVLHGVVTDDPAEVFGPNESEQHVAVVRVQHGRFDGAWSHPLSHPRVADSRPDGPGSPSAKQQGVGWRPTEGLVRARIDGSREALAYGDDVLLAGRLSRVPPPGNPGQYDWRAALARHRIYALLSVKPHEATVCLRRGRGRWWWRAAYALRHRWEHLMARSFDGGRAALLRSLLLGQRAQLNEGLKQAFVETGTIHLLVISGFNVGLIAWLLDLALRLAGAGRRLRLLLCAIGVFGYALLTGMQPPVVRATIMAWIVLGAFALDRVIHWPTTVAAAALVILLVDPAQIVDASCQLSFGAVVSLLVFAPSLRAWFETHLTMPEGWLHRYLAVGLASTCAVWVGLWPVLAWYFHLVAPVSVVANLLLVPLVSLLVAVGTATFLLGTLAAPVVAWTAWPLSWLLDVTVWCVRGCHALPWGYWTVGHPSWGLIAGYYGLLLLTLMRRRARISAGWVVAVWLAGLNLWLWGQAVRQMIPSPWLEATVLDVGRGASVFIRTPNRQAILVDAGDEDAGRYDVIPFLRYRGVRVLDALILTRLDAHHAGGAVPLLHAMPVRRLVTNGAAPSSWAGQETLRLAAARHIPQEPVRAGQRLTGLGGVEMMVALHEPGLVLRLAYERHTLRLPLQRGAEQARREGAVTMRTDGTRLVVTNARGHHDPLMDQTLH